MIEPGQLASNVCARCKGRKKKCDKALPRCARCTRLGVKCVYSTDAPEPVHLPTPPDLDDGHQHMMALSLKHQTRLFPEIISPFAFVTPSFELPQGNYLLEGDSEILDFDEQYTKQVFDIINRFLPEGDTLCQFFPSYFESIHPWFPFLSEDEVRNHIATLKTTTRAELACLLLSMHLVTQMSHMSGECIQRLYLTTKNFHGMMVSTGRMSLEVVQAGLLIALYEHSQALHESCYLSLGGCARAGYQLGLHTSLSQLPASDPQDQRKQLASRRLWWAIIILERMSILEQLDRRLPFAIPTPSLISDLLPTADINAIRPVAAGLKISVVPVPNPSQFTENPHLQTETFVQLAQAAYLLSRVIDHIYEGAGATDSPCRAGRLDETLQHYSMSLLNDDERDNGYQCWPYSICMSALLELNRFELTAKRAGVSEEISRILTIRASLAVQSVMRMIFHGIGEWSDVSVRGKLPVWCLHSAYDAALLRIQLEDKPGNEEETFRSVELVKSALRQFEPQWKIAATYVKAIEDAERFKWGVIC